MINQTNNQVRYIQNVIRCVTPIMLALFSFNSRSGLVLRDQFLLDKAQMLINAKLMIRIFDLKHSKRSVAFTIKLRWGVMTLASQEGITRITCLSRVNKFNKFSCVGCSSHKNNARVVISMTLVVAYAGVVSWDRTEFYYKDHWSLIFGKYSAKRLTGFESRHQHLWY